MRKNIDDMEIIISEILKRAEPDDRLLQKNIARIRRNPRHYANLLWELCADYDITLELTETQAETQREKDLIKEVFVLEGRLKDLRGVKPNIDEMFGRYGWSDDDQQKVEAEKAALNQQLKKAKAELADLRYHL